MILEYLLILLCALLLLFVPVAGGTPPAAWLAAALQDRWASLAWLLSLY